MNRSLSEMRTIVRDMIPEGLVVADHDAEGHAYVHTPTRTRARSVTTKSGILDAPHLKKWAAKLAVEHMIATYTPGMTREELRKIGPAAILVHQDQFEDAGQIGTLGHNAIERYLKQWLHTGEKPANIRDFIGVEEDSRIFAIARSAELFFNDFDFLPIASELKIFSKRYNYAGTLDCLGVIRKTLIKGKDFEHEHVYLETSKSRSEYLCTICQQKTKLVFALIDFKTSNSADHAEYAMQTGAYRTALAEMTNKMLKPEEVIIVQLSKEKAQYQAFRVVDPLGAFRAFTHVAKVYDWLNNSEEKIIPLIGKTHIYATDPRPQTPSGLTPV